MNEDDTVDLVQGEIVYILENGNCFNFEKASEKASRLYFHGDVMRLYTCLRETVTEHLKSKANSLVLVTQNDFLQTINAIWNRHKTSMAHISKVLMYMDKIYVIQNDFANVIDLGLQIFRDQIYRCNGIQEKLRGTLLDLIRQERNGEEVDSLAIKNVCQMLRDIGFGDRSFYETDYELPFLQQTAKFYEVAIQNHSTENSASSCLKNFKRRMIEEYERAKNSFDNVTVARVVAVFEQLLINILRDTLLDIARPERKILGLNSFCISESEFDLPFLKKSAELYEPRIMYLSTENVVSLCVGRVKSRLIEVYRRSTAYLKPYNNAEMVANVETELVEKLKNILINTIVAKRNGEVVDCLTTKNVLQILQIVILGINYYFLDNGLVELAEDFYKEIPNCLSENSALKCIEMLKQQTIAVYNWAKCYLDENTEAETVSNIGAVVQQQMSAIVEMKISGITQRFKCRNSEGLGGMYKQFCSWVQDSLISQSDVHEPQKDGAENCAITFIQNLLKLKRLVDHCAINLFQRDENSKRIFKAVHDFGFMQLINVNEIIPECLSLFIDDKIKNVAKEISKQESEALLNEAILLSKFLLKKDLFEDYYRKHLANRLLLNKTVSYAYEKDVISKFKVECGHQFNAKLEGMMQDIAISDAQMKEFKEHTRKHGVSLDGIDLNVTVITARFWPFQSVRWVCAMPNPHMKVFESFTSFYSTKHQGRKLILKPLLGYAELSATFLKPTREEREGVDEVLPSTLTSDVSQLTSVINNGPRKFQIVVSTYQMCILLLFNNRNELTYDEIKYETGIPNEDLTRALQSLAMGNASQRILIKHPKSKEKESSDVFSVNDNFSSQLNRIKIQTVKTKRDSESEPERKVKRQKVDDGRKYEIEAAIVRIMKARQKLSHNDLVVEVTEQLKSRSFPKPADVKRGIEVLIDRAYLARTTDDRKVYTYLT